MNTHTNTNTSFNMKNTKRFFATLALVTAGALCCSCTPEEQGMSKEAKEQGMSKEAKEQAVAQACEQSRQAIERRAAELSQWYLAHRSGSENAAEELTSLYGKWITLSGEQSEKEAYIREVFSRYLYSAEDARRKEVEAAAQLLQDLRDIENELAVRTGCFSIASPEKGAAPGSVSSLNPGACPAHMQQALQTELTTMAGTALAEAVGVRMAVSAGILTAGAASSVYTFGAGIVAGVAVDALVSWVTDPEGKIAAEIDNQLEATAREQRERYRQTMLKVLDNKRRYWMSEI